MNKLTKSLIISFIIIIFVVALDIVSKTLIFKYIGENNSVVLIKNLLSIEPVYNTGASFGMLKGMQWFFIVTSLLVLILITWYFVKLKTTNPLYILTFSFIFSGAVGNLIDRLFLFKVRDFIYIHFFPAVFNVADIFITLGVMLFIICGLVELLKKRKSENNGKV